MPRRNLTLVIPAYEPARTMPALVSALADDFASVVVVDDGSRSPEAADAFAALAGMPSVRLLRHAANRGKGAALKTAFADVLRHAPDCAGVVTADADGQHLTDDIRRVADATLANPGRVTLGVRSFSGSVPFRSRLGNFWTCGEFFLLTRRWVRDTQTGLRGIPRALLPRLAALAGDRYDYEARMLVAAARLPGGPVQVPIATVYLEGNKTSHYRPLADTLSTQLALFRAAIWYNTRHDDSNEDRAV
jgi:glycosyltransferase involved in cell wall biosynthesis